MVTRREDHLFLVVNAACKEADTAHLRAQHRRPAALIEPLPERALLALQGPKAAAVMARLAPELAQLTFMTGGEATIARHRLLRHALRLHRRGRLRDLGRRRRGGSARPGAARRARGRARPASARATRSRLEAGLCLYGHDIDTTTTPVEAGLTWAIQKVRRPGGARAGGYPGAAVIDGAARRRRADASGSACVGLERVPVREGAHIVDDAGAAIGRVTSGTVGPSVGQPIAMAYVPSALAAPGTRAPCRRARQAPADARLLPCRSRRIATSAADAPHFVSSRSKR